MTETVSACPLCGESASEPFDQRVFHGVRVSNQNCRACGLVFQSPRMAEAELQEFYAAEYRRLYQGSEGPSANDLAVQTQRASALITFLQGAIPAPAAPTEDSICLDIGCSAGKLLEAYARAFGCRVVGIEPGDAYRQEDQRRGLDVYASLEGFEVSGLYPCHLISLIHVLEHLPHPVEYLVHLRQKLLHADGGAGTDHQVTEQGWLLLEVPNLYCHDCFEVAHLTSFSAHTLVQTLDQAGFEIVAFKKHGAPRSRWLPLYITVLAKARRGVGADTRVSPMGADTRVSPYSATGGRRAVIPERGVWLKRRLGMLRKSVVTAVM